MQRRHLLGLLGVAGLGAAATGYWRLPLAAAPAALTLPAAMQLLERLAQASLHSVAGWPPAMVFNPCILAAFVEAISPISFSFACASM